jgi:hypothetical protein
MAAVTKALFNSLTLKHRYDYFPSIKQFVLRMPSVLHELVSGEVVREITRQLDSITSYEDESAQFARNITSSASGVIKLPDPEYGRHDPDASFGYLRTRYPGVVIEVSYSQKRKDLPYLADEYILGSNGNIRVVIGLDVEYRGKMATLSIWRPRFSINGDGDEELEAEQTVVNQVCLTYGIYPKHAHIRQRFRDENGKPDLNSEADLNLRLEDFAPEIIVKSFTNLQKHISISSQNLCAYLDVAEALNLTRNHEGGVETPVRANLKKRKREKTPPEELEPEREARFRKEEERVAKRIMRDDPDYSASSVSGSDPDSS